MKEIASDLQMIVVNIAAGIAFHLTVTIGYNDVLTVRNTEQFFIVTVNKANVPISFLYMLIYPAIFSHNKSSRSYSHLEQVYNEAGMHTYQNLLESRTPWCSYLSFRCPYFPDKPST